MSNANLYSAKPRVFLIKPHHTIDDDMLDRFISRRLIPAFDMFPEINLSDAEVDRLLMSKEVADLPMDIFDSVEQSLNALSDLVGVDWIVIPRTMRRELFVAQVDHYEHIRYQAHLHVKHYIVIHNEFTIPYSNLNNVLLHSIGSQTNLSELSFDLYKIIQQNKPEELESIPDRTIIEAQDEDLSFLDNNKEDDPIDIQPSSITQNKAIIDNQIITPASLPSIQRKMDDIFTARKLHTSVLEMQDYLRTNMSEIAEFHNADSDLAFRGKWNDDTPVKVLAFNLTDKRENSAWLIKILSENKV